MNKPTVKQVQNALFWLMPTAPLLGAAATFFDSRPMAKLLLAAAGTTLGAVSGLVYARLGKVVEEQQKQAKAVADALQAKEEKEQAISQAEYKRRRRLLAMLRQHYLLSHDGVSPEMMSGLEPMPTVWVDRQLESMGETWRQDIYL